MQGSMHGTEQEQAASGASLWCRPWVRDVLAGMVRRMTRKGFLGAIALPVLALLFFYGYVINVRLSLGRWPHFGEPVHALLHRYYDAVRRVGGSLSLSILPVLVLAIGCLFFRRLRHVAIYFVCYVLALAMAFGAACLAPGSFLNWFLD